MNWRDHGRRKPETASHLLVFLGYMIFFGIYLVQLIDNVILQKSTASAKRNALILVALTENELRGLSKENVLYFMGGTRYRATQTRQGCIFYGFVSLAFQEGKFVSYDTDAGSIGSGFGTLKGPCDFPGGTQHKKENEQ